MLDVYYLVIDQIQKRWYSVVSEIHGQKPIKHKLFSFDKPYDTIQSMFKMKSRKRYAEANYKLIGDMHRIIHINLHNEYYQSCFLEYK